MKWLEETHGARFELVRHFLARMFDSELLPGRGQWQTVAVSAFAMLLPAGLLLVKEGSMDYRVTSQYRRLAQLATPGPFRAQALADELALLTLVLAVTGMVALLEWQSLFPSKRDYLALAGFPVRSRQIFGARFLAVLLFSTALVCVLNLLPSIIEPLETAGRWQKNPHYAVNLLAQAAASGLGCFFVLFALVALQGVLLNIVPRAWFARISIYAQGVLITVLLLAALFSWFIGEWDEKTIARLPEFGAWAPPVWFAGLHERLLGDRDLFFSAMAGRALIATAAAFALAALMYLLSYRRYRVLLLEAPDQAVAPRVREWSLLGLLARSPKRKAALDFMVKTMSRSRTHRVMLLAYMGAAAGLMLNSSLIAGAALRWSAGWRAAVQFVVLFWPLGVSLILLTGFRHILSLPAELPANWIFQLRESEGRAQWMSAVERFIIAGAVLPIYVLLWPAAVVVLGWALAVRTAVLQLLISLSIFEIVFYSWQQLPFTCSYRPGKKPLVMIVGGYVMALGFVVPALAHIVAAMSRFNGLFVFFAIVLGSAWIWLRRLRRDGWGEARILFEDLFEAVPNLGLRS